MELTWECVQASDYPYWGAKYCAKYGRYNLWITEDFGPVEVGWCQPVWRWRISCDMWTWDATSKVGKSTPDAAKDAAIFAFMTMMRGRE